MSKSPKMCHLHNHSHYSLLDGLASTKDLVITAKDLGYKSLALTDHGSCAGLLQFQRDALSHDIKPILGMEGYITDDHLAKHKETRAYHIVLLAKNQMGLRNLMNLSSIAFIDGFYRKPRFDWDLLLKYKDGLVVTSACCIGEISTYIWEGNMPKAEEVAARYKDAFGDDFYIEIMMHKYKDNKDQEDREKKLSNELYKMSKRMDIKAICTNDTHYAKKRDWEYHDTLLAMQTHDNVKNTKRKLSFNSEDFYLKPYEEMEKIYGKVPELLTNTLEIAEKVDDTSRFVEDEKDLLPPFTLPEGFTNETSYLKYLVKKGMEEHGLIKSKVHRERIRYEMSVILTCKYERYFLILWDLINFANRNKVRLGIGRGCFTPDNTVMTRDGIKLISKLCKGDMVLAYDDEFHEILDTHEYEVNEEIVDFEINDGKTISCTLDHKIHVIRDGSLCWVEAVDLKEGDDIYDINVG